MFLTEKTASKYWHKTTSKASHKQTQRINERSPFVS